MAHAVAAVAMGSVGPDHRCRVCGRVGHGGYVVDGLFRFGPICTKMRDSCLDRLLGPQTVEELDVVLCRKLPTHLLSMIIDFYPRLEPDDILAQALSRLIFRKLLPYALVERIVEFYDVDG